MRILILIGAKGRNTQTKFAESMVFFCGLFQKKRLNSKLEFRLKTAEGDP
jgi:hypothetical protein